MAVVVRSAMAEKPQDVMTALEKIAPTPQDLAPVEVDEFGDRVRNGWVVGFWDRVHQTS